MLPEMLTVPEIAQRLNVSAALVYEWVGSGVLTCYRLGKAKCRGAIRVAEADLVAFLETLKTQKKPEAVKPPAAKRKPKSAFQHIAVP